MSTRSHIIIKGAKPMIYRHCDGYPGKADGSEPGVLADITPFLSKFKKWRGGDKEYLTARLTQHLGNLFERDAEEEEKYGPNFLSLGIDLGLHGDEDYVHIIDTSKPTWTVQVREAKPELWDHPALRNTKLVETVKEPEYVEPVKAAK